MQTEYDRFVHSKTKENLMRAFAGESQARSRYTISAGLARKDGMAVIEGVFLYTADQERVHAQQFYQQLSVLGGQTVAVDGTYPVDIFTDLKDYLLAAQHNEYQEFERDYREFADIAAAEDFPHISTLFDQIARIEQTHGERFGRYAKMIEDGTLFLSEVEVQWTCLHCGYVATAKQAPKQCPVCRHPQGFFIRTRFSPWQG